MSPTRFAKTTLVVGFLAFSAIGCDALDETSSSEFEADASAPSDSTVETISSDIEELATKGFLPAGGPAIYHESGEGSLSASGYVVRDGEIIVEGDISLGTLEEAWEVHDEIARAIQNSDEKALVRDRRFRLWENGVIEFRIESAFLPNEMAVIRGAIGRWNNLANVTGLRWVENADLGARDSGVRFHRGGGGCSSPVGWHHRRQDVKLDPASNCVSATTVEHEMGHAMGLFHEHQREDRADNIITYTSNGDLTMMNNWTLRVIGTAYGKFDVQSVMQYDTRNFARNSLDGQAKLSTFISRHEMSLWTIVNPTSDTRITSEVIGYNRRSRLDQHWLFSAASPNRPTDLRVVDVDGDGLDDLVASARDGLVFSQSASSGWIPLFIGGQRVSAPLATVRFGQFDDEPGIDVLVIDGINWRLVCSSGVERRIARRLAFTDSDVADVTGDGRDDLILVNTGGWMIANGTDILATPTTIAGSALMGVSSIQLVRNNSGAFRVVAISNTTMGRNMVRQALRESPVFSPVWTTIPLPMFGVTTPNARLLSIDDLHFGDVDGQPGVDLLLPANGVGVPNADIASPVAVFGVFDSATRRTVRIPSRPIVPNIQNALAGRFRSGILEFITAGQILDNSIARSDAGGLGAVYSHFRGATVTDKWPLPPSPSGGTVATVGIVETLDLRANERIEFGAALTSRFGVGPVDVVVQRRARSGWVTIETTSSNQSGKTATVERVFAANGGEWRISIVARDPRTDRFSDWDEAVWNVRVSGLGACGDGFHDLSEDCDDGNNSAGDGCSQTCTIEPGVCGDGRIVPPEYCDDGNVVSGDGCSSQCMFENVCGNGIVELGEQCDDGPNNGTICESSRCHVDCVWCIE